MTTDTVKPGNFSAAQIAELQSRAKNGPLNGDIAKALAATPLFAGKTSRSIISKISNLGLAYAKQGVKTKVEGAKAQEETVMQVQDEIRAFLNIPAATSLNQKAGWLAIRSAVSKLVSELDEAEGTFDEPEQPEVEA